MKSTIFFIAIMLFAGSVMAQGGPPYDGTGAVEGNSPVDVGNVTEITLHDLDEGSELIDITLQWDANTEPDLAGYKIYYKMAGGKIYFAATAYDTEGLESGFSNEVNSWDRFTGIAPITPVIVRGEYTLSNGTVVVINSDGSLTITLPDGSVVNITP